NEAGTRAIEHPKYVMRITGDSPEGKAELDNFIDPESRFPVIATTSDLMTTGVDARTCKLIVLDKTINSMTTFKQIIGRGTRILEEYNKFFFTIMDSAPNSGAARNNPRRRPRRAQLAACGPPSAVPPK